MILLEQVCWYLNVYYFLLCYVYDFLIFDFFVYDFMIWILSSFASRDFINKLLCVETYLTGVSQRFKELWALMWR